MSFSLLSQLKLVNKLGNSDSIQYIGAGSSFGHPNYQIKRGSREVGYLKVEGSLVLDHVVNDRAHSSHAMPYIYHNTCNNLNKKD